MLSVNVITFLRYTYRIFCTSFSYNEVCRRLKSTLQRRSIDPSRRAPRLFGPRQTSRSSVAQHGAAARRQRTNPGRFPILCWPVRNLSQPSNIVSFRLKNIDATAPTEIILGECFHLTYVSRPRQPATSDTFVKYFTVTAQLTIWKHCFTLHAPYYK